MLRKDDKIAQAAIELAVFGAILIFILGTIVRTAVGNGYSQDQNFKAMRMAMLASWNGSKAANMSRNSASVLFVEDRLSPDFNKYGDLDRNPFIAQGSGTFSYELLYPLDSTEVSSNLPLMDIYINGQHFPLTTASYTSKTITRPACPGGGPYPQGTGLSQGQCLQNQCLRNAREWVGGTVDASQFDNILQGTLNSNALVSYGTAIFQALVRQGFVGTSTGTDTVTSGYVTTAFSTLPSNFSITDPNTNQPSTLTQQQINSIQTILQGDKNQYKLFYTIVANGSSQFSAGASDAMFDLQRNNIPSTFVPPAFRPYIAWQWSTSPATSAASIGLDPSSNQYPTFDIDGRLKEVTIYGFSQNPDGTPNVTYEDPQGGDIDGSWDITSCGAKPGLQSQSQIYTFTKQGTYLQIKEGKLYNPETDQFVRSANQRDTIDLIQRTIQLSNNTGRFCDGSGNVLGTVGNDGVTPNPVEVCIPPGSGDNCFSTEQNIKSTCYDENNNRIFVRSRLEDQRGHFWMTDTSGQMSIK